MSVGTERMSELLVPPPFPPSFRFLALLPFAGAPGAPLQVLPFHSGSSSLKGKQIKIFNLN